MLACLCLCACGGSTTLRGDGDADDAPSVDVVHEVLADPVPEPDLDVTPEMACDPLPELPLPDGRCCPEPLVLDPTRGICVDTTDLGRPCSEPDDTCSFGQRCESESGFMPLGMFCHLPCGYGHDYLCPEGWVCDPERCCDIPESGCVVDHCEPPLLMQVDRYECVSTEGLGMDCTTIESCNPGQSCVSWEGVTGETFWTCELECEEDWPRLCPNGYRCVDWEDGPQSVCEPIPAVRGCDDPSALVCGYPDKFRGTLTRANVCSDCQGVVICVEGDYEGDYSEFFHFVSMDDSRISEFIHDYGTVYSGLCGSPLTGIALPLRPEAGDCRCSLPSDFYWTAICYLTDLHWISSVHCFPPE